MWRGCGVLQCGVACCGVVECIVAGWHGGERFIGGEDRKAGRHGLRGGEGETESARAKGERGCLGREGGKEGMAGGKGRAVGLWTQVVQCLVEGGEVGAEFEVRLRVVGAETLRTPIRAYSAYFKRV